MSISNDSRTTRIERGAIAPTLVEATFGLERLAGGAFLPRHRHRHGYVALVVAGAYTEAGERGTLRVSAGDLLLHGAFDAHLDRVARGGARILNIEVPDWLDPPFARAHLADVDEVVRLAERDRAAALRLLLSRASPTSVPRDDWPDELAAMLCRQSDLRIGEWARVNGLADATVSRGFAAHFGLPPSRFRAQVRARRAWRELRIMTTPLAQIASELGFSDQAHMTRAVTALTGRSPRMWRDARQMDSRQALPRTVLS